MAYSRGNGGTSRQAGNFSNLGNLVRSFSAATRAVRNAALCSPSLGFKNSMKYDVPRDGHVAGHGKFRAGEEGFDLAEEGRVRLRFEQGDEVAEEGDARRGVGVGRSVHMPVRGENLAGFLQLAEHDEGER